ncbi:MAG: hypothetical protein ACFFB3_12170 [Candidatus Hodarchaeota archaeon]
MTQHEDTGSTPEPITPSEEKETVDPNSKPEEGPIDEEKPEELALGSTLPDREDREIEEEKKLIKKEALGKFLRKHVLDATMLLIALISLIGIVFLSRDLVPDRDIVNPENIIGYDTNTHVMIFILSIVAFWLILIVFSKMIFLNRGHDFGIETWSFWRKAIFFIMTLIFVSSVYMLLDVAAINSFLLMGSNTIIWDVRNEFLADSAILSEIPSTTNRLAYAQIRAIAFTLFYIALLIFPVMLFLLILTRRGRARLLSPQMGTRKYQILKKIFKYITYGFLIVGVISIPVFFIVLGLPGNALLFLIFLIIMGLVVIGILFVVLYGVLKAFDVAKWMLMSNLIMLAPIIFLFFIFPIFTWTLWDIYLILDTGTLDGTIYVAEDISFVNADVPSNYDLQDMELGDQILFFGRTFYFNFFAYQRVLMMDFIIIVGLAALIIGLAEGYSIVAIFSAMFKGVSVARTGQIVQETPPTMVVLTTRLVLLTAWLILVWDNLLTIWQDLLPRFNISLPEIKAPGVLEVLRSLAAEMLDVDVLVPFGLLIIPLYFIVSSSLKFFSVTIVSERVKHDANLIFLLTSSAFVLIVTAIFGDIAAMDEFKPGGDHNPYLPLSDTPLLPLLPDIIDIIEIILAVSFYLGLIIALLYFIRFMARRFLKKEMPDTAVI